MKAGYGEQAVVRSAFCFMNNGSSSQTDRVVDSTQGRTAGSDMSVAVAF